MADEPQSALPIPVSTPSATAEPDATNVPAATLPDEGSGVALAPGVRPLPEYELKQLLGRGGFGEVWRATGPGGFDIALKFIRLGGLAAQIELRSLELVKGIRHPHLLPLFGAWLKRDYLIVATELAECTLLQRWQQCHDQGLNGIPPAELLEYIREAAEGLDYLNDVRHHSPTGGALTGVQHKDVKPQNLLLVGGAVKVADFGLVQVLEQSAVIASGGLTPAYAAPEFFLGRTTPWSDQYSLAVTYCHLRGGRLPFTGSVARVMASHVSQPPDLDMLPEGERGAVERALAKEPSRRWPSCGAFAEALAAGMRSATPAPPIADAATSDPAAIRMGELKRALAATDPAAVLVNPRVLRRLLQAEFDVPYLFTQAPHESCYFFDRQALFRYVEPDDLGLEPDHLLPPTVILLAKPSPELLQDLGREGTLLRSWRLLFHARVHVALHRRQEEGHLTAADVLARVEQIGAAEFVEIRTVLRQENVLPPTADDLSVYVEFVATYLEMRYFRVNLLPTYFPVLQDLSRIDEVVAHDVDGATLFASTRLPGAPNPVVRADTSSDESHDYFNRLLRHAERAERDGDLVRSAIERTRAARVAPASLALDTRAQALRDLKQLTQQLQDALKLSEEELAEWLQVLPALLEKADQGRWPVEAKLLYDLQKICHENGRKLYALDLVEWVLSAGKRPIKRPLNLLQSVHNTNHLRSAVRRLTMARVSDEDRQRLARLLQNALQGSEERLRGRVRPILQDAFSDVGLSATNPPEQVALRKMIEELLDRLTETGFFTFSDLRDTVSGNQLKLPDLADPNAFLRGDPLLRLDRRLSTSMEGVYRPGEFYLRRLEAGSSLLFGTAAGRLLTRNVLMPFGGAFVLLWGVLFFWTHLTHRTDQLPAVSFVPLGFFLLCLMHLEGLRAWFVEAGRRLWQGLRFALWEVPARVWRLPWLQRLFHSWPFLLLYWYALKPLLVYVVLLSLWPERFWSWPVALATFVLANLFLNSRFGAAVGEAIREAVALLYSWLRFEAIQGLVRMVGNFFKQVTEAVESVLYSVDEWLRFRSDVGRVSMALRAVLGAFWFPVRYIFRLYFLTLIEPSLNPLKLPFSILAAKFFVLIPNYVKLMSPGTEVQETLINDQLAPNIGWGAAVLLTYLIIVPTLWLLPSAVAFLIWEMRGNWRLFRANRPTTVRPAIVGHHGETVLQLLRLGAHSGTVPRLYARLRNAERVAYHSGDWRPARGYRQTLREVGNSVEVFVEREFVALLHQSKSWPGQPVRVAQVVLSCARIRIELTHADFPKEATWLMLEEQYGWLFGGVQEAGWVRRLTAEQRQALSAALVGLFKLAGVDFIREQLAAVLPVSNQGYQLTEHQLIVWADLHKGRAVAYDLSDRRPELVPHDLMSGEPAPAPPLDARRVFFSRVPLAWEEWSAYWQRDQKGEEPPPLFGEALHLWRVEGQDTVKEVNSL